MRKNPVTTKAPSEQVVKDIRRATRKLHSSEEKIRIVLSGLRGEDSIAELCRKEGIAERGYDSNVLKQIRQAIMAEDSDLFDVLAHIAYATEPMTRQERADAGALAIRGNYDEKLGAFLTFVLGQYVEAGAEGLDRSILPVFLQLKYGNPVDGAKALGGVETVAGSYVGFQKHLYSQV